MAKSNRQKNANGSALDFEAQLWAAVGYPSKPEQERIADFLSALDELIAAQSAKLAALQTHKQGLMQQLFPSATT